MNVIDYITITCNLKKTVDYRLHPITWKNVIDYNDYDYPMSDTIVMLSIMVSFNVYF